MRLVSVLILVGLVISGPVRGADRNKEWIGYGMLSCGEYLDAYSRTTFTGSKMTGPHDMFQAYGWVSGSLSYYNAFVENGKDSILGSMSVNDALKWIGSWCRDNPQKTLPDAVSALIYKLK
jgi:hypothetical protein